jgi:hypothetical protein
VLTLPMVSALAASAVLANSSDISVLYMANFPG